MLKPFVNIGLSLIIFLAPWAICNARDYLKEGDQQSDHPEEWEIRYDKAVRHVFSRAWQKDIVVRTVHLPPFDPEWVAGIIRAPNGYRAFELEASKQIWGASHHPERDLPKIHAIYKERPVSESLAERIAAIWRAVLGDRRNYGKDPGLYLDTSQLVFFVGLRPGEHLTANTLLPDRHTKTRWLWEISVALLDYVDRKSSGDAVERIVRRAANNVRLNH